MSMQILKAKTWLGVIAYAALILGAASCGNNVNIPKKVKTESKVRGTVVVVHKFEFDLETFKAVCESEFKDVVNDVERQLLVEECQAERLGDFLDLIASFSADVNDEEVESEEE